MRNEGKKGGREGGRKRRRDRGREETNIPTVVTSPLEG
jgi:hypothetical protein